MQLPFQSKQAQERKNHRKIDFKDAASTAAFLVVFIGIWEVIFLLGVFPIVSLPSPLMVAQSLVDLIAEGTLIYSTAVTLLRLFVGFSTSIIIGVGVGLAMVKFPQFGKTMNSFAVGLQSFPSIAWVPFAILLIGLNDSGILFVVIMSSVFSIMISTYSGIRNIPPIYIRSARNMGAKGISLFRHVMLPAATPSLIVGIRQGWSFAWHALVGAEMLITTLVGLGYILSVGREFSNMPQIIAAMIVIFTIGWIFDRLVFSKIDEKVRDRWGLNQHTER
jgi:NitT/TauT family transport system permease protein